MFMAEGIRLRFWVRGDIAFLSYFYCTLDFRVGP